MLINYQDKTSRWFAELQTKICTNLEVLESEFGQQEATFRRKKWERPGGGGGTMAILEGDLFEKAGVNVSTVYGTFSEIFREQIPGAKENPNFWASGLSIVIHPKSPLVPIIHMNTRHIQTTKAWFGGGIDLTPVFPNDDDTRAFHGGLKRVCDTFDETYYPRFKRWADDYFFIKHRQEPRGVGGIFYDNLENTLEKDFDFTKAVGESFINLYQPLVEKYARTPWTPEEQEKQLVKRGRYVEFNLVYDRGTTFGLKTDGFIEAILMSLPPMAAWPTPNHLFNEAPKASQTFSNIGQKIVL